MIPKCPHCQKNILRLNAKDLTQCPSCQQAITPKKQWGIAAGLGLISLLIATCISFFIVGNSKTTHMVGGFAGIATFLILLYRFEKKDDVV